MCISVVGIGLMSRWVYFYLLALSKEFSLIIQDKIESDTHMFYLMILNLQLIKFNYVKVLTVSSVGDFVANLRAKITDNHKGYEVQVFELDMSVLKSLSF